MCGIVGIYNLRQYASIEEGVLRQMLAMLRHRGPDQFGIYRDNQIALGSARLSIIDLNTGQQPISNEDGTMWIVFNGEIFNYLELRAELENRGHRFQTNSDTEVILHLYEEYGAKCLARLNGQFALAIWDSQAQRLFLGRDRCGVRPIFYTFSNGYLIFGSEVKALLAHPAVSAEIDPIAIDQTFSYWSPLSPRSSFKNIQELPAGHYLLAEQDKYCIEAYWRIEFPDASSSYENRSLEDYLSEFRNLLIDATQIRLRADVPVGAYLSGGLDSSIIASIIRNHSSNQLTTFSISFSDAEFDESAYQRQMVEQLGTEHHVVHISEADIANVFQDVIWHTETPILRTAPAPMFLLSRLVHEQGFKVVLTGEGADEFLAGYDIFKEAQIRRFWAKQADSRLRPSLLRRLYPYIPALNSNSNGYLSAFFAQNLQEVDKWDYSHLLRWQNTARAKRFFTPDLHQAVAEARLTAAPEIRLPPEFAQWHPLHRAQYLEISIFLSQYLLSSQGDRMGMAHSVEGRFPFLDYRVTEFCNQLPPHLKLRGLTEKFLLKRLAKEWLPETIWKRVKQPYRAPIHRSFFSRFAPDYVQELLSVQSIQSVGLFEAAMVQRLVQKIERGSSISESDDMALVGILSSQILSSQFVENFKMPAALSNHDDIKICEPTQIA